MPSSRKRKPVTSPARCRLSPARDANRRADDVESSQRARRKAKAHGDATTRRCAAVMRGWTRRAAMQGATLAAASTLGIPDEFTQAHASSMNDLTAVEAVSAMRCGELAAETYA